MKEKKTRVRIFFAMIMVIALCMEIITPMLGKATEIVPVAEGEIHTATGSENMAQFITAVELRHEDLGGKVVASGDAIKWGDKIHASYTFVMSVDAVSAVLENIPYEVDLPENLKEVFGTDGKEVKGKTNGGEEKTIGVFKVGSNRKLQFVFDDQLKTNFSTGIDRANLYFQCELDKDNIGTSINVPISWNFVQTSGGVNIIAKDNLPVPPEITSKKGAIQTNGSIQWTIEVKKGNQFEGSLKIEDTFLTSDLTYVDQSFKIDGTAATSGSVTNTTSEDNTIISYEISPDAALNPMTKNLTITYETNINDALFDNTNSKFEVKNQVELVANDITINGTKKESIVSVENKWMTKDVVGTPDLLNRTIDWKITVTGNKRNLTNLIVHDDLPDEFVVIAGSIKVNNTSVSSRNVACSACDLEIDITQAYKDTKENGDTVITYQTNIPDSYFDDNKEHKATNKAWLTFDWETFNGSGRYQSDYGIPGISKDTNITATRIQKTAGTYNKATQEIDWTVTVNPYGVDLDSIVVTDEIEAGQEFVVNSQRIKISDKDGGTTGGGNVDKAQFKFDPITNDPSKTGKWTFWYPKSGTERPLLGKQMVVIEYKTKVTNKEHYGYNEKSTHSNTAQLLATQGGIVFTGKATKAVPVESNVLTKAGIGYDYKDQMITWQVTVNDNGMEMISPEILDTIPVGQMYVENSLDWGSTNPNPTANTGYSINLSSNKLNIKLGDKVNNKIVFTYKTKVDVANISNSLEQTGERELKNDITLSRTGFDNLSVVGVQKINNNIISKRAIYSKNAYIDYEIFLNQNAIPLKDGTIEDQLPKGLALDTDTVKLVEMSINNNGDLVAPEIDQKSKISFTYDGSTGKIVFNINEPGNGRYKLSYRADIMQIDNLNIQAFSNQVKYGGSGEMASSQGVATVRANLELGGSGWAAKAGRGSIMITKKDSKTSEALEGVVLMLTDESQQYILEEKTTDANGIAKFENIKVGKKYQVIEKTVPEGYKKSDEVQTFDIQSGNKDQVYVWNNEKLHSVSFKKVSESGTPVVGAVFNMWKSGDPSTAKQSASTADGVNFKDVETGKYEIQEISAPFPYMVNGEVFTVMVTDTDNDITEIQDSSGKSVTKVENKAMPINPLNYSISFKKVDEKDAALKGAVFALYSGNGKMKEETILQTATSDSNGNVKFENVGKAEYRIKEIKAPDQYEIDSQVYIGSTMNGSVSALIGSSGDKVEKIINKPKNPEEPDTPEEPDKPLQPEDPSMPPDLESGNIEWVSGSNQNLSGSGSNLQMNPEQMQILNQLAEARKSQEELEKQNNELSDGDSNNNLKNANDENKKTVHRNGELVSRLPKTGGFRVMLLLCIAGICLIGFGVFKVWILVKKKE